MVPCSAYLILGQGIGSVIFYSSVIQGGKEKILATLEFSNFLLRSIQLKCSCTISIYVCKIKFLTVLPVLFCVWFKMYGFACAGATCETSPVSVKGLTCSRHYSD